MEKVTFEDSKERLVQMDSVWICEKGLFFQLMQDHLEKKGFWVAKKAAFSVRAKPTDKEKLFFNTAKSQFRTAPQLTCNHPFRIPLAYCELAVKQPFFETSQSCVSTTVTLSHRFKSSPAIPGKVAIPGAAGYMMNAGHFRENLESSGDLNRPRSPEVRKPLGYSPFFSYKRKE